MPTLYVVATPIGNLGDMTPRAIETLKNVGLIAAEDTRVTMKLLNAFDIQTPITSCHEHNEKSKAAQIVARMLAENMDVAVTTDAGTPCISDPGSILAHEAIANGVSVLAIPGATAMASALSVSGMEIEEFTFYGFLPRQKSELKEKLTEMARRSKIAVVHESPHRVIELLETLQALLPHTEVSASCDLTKKFEYTCRGTVDAVLGELRSNPKADRGEYCLCLRWAQEDIPAPEKPKSEASLEARLLDCLLSGLSLREAQAKLIEEGERKNAVYAAALRLKAMLKEE
ncbi:MAG: 16S rRNA (cytidine(1402)-2'-O)-methyltransferase [Eubacteriales bacterium]|nr:16S rRNA (cytidine(1402)-2'-O)-methyltransferase [Eubacteriales bacterium]